MAYKTLSSGFTHKHSISSIVHRTFSSGSHWQAINGTLGLRVPAQVTKTKCVQYMRRGKPSHRTQLINDTAYSIVAQYQAEYRGVVQYYRLAYNLHQLSKRKRVMEVSQVKTLANKYKTSCGDIYKRSFDGRISPPSQALSSSSDRRNGRRFSRERPDCAVK